MRLKSNPVLRKSMETTAYSTTPMTKAGTWSKVFTLLLLVTAAAGTTWMLVPTIGEALLFPLMIGSLILGLILALVITFKPRTAPVVAPLYGIVEGVFVGLISYFFEAMLPGIVGRAVLTTFIVAFAMWFVYSTGLVKVTQKFRAGVTAAIFTVMLLYLVQIGMSFFGSGLPFMTGSSPLAIGVQFVIVIIASLALVLDFDYIARQVESRAPKELEWVAAFGLIVTLIWLYIELLDLLYRLAMRD
ncbi:MULTISPECIES: Bax inhibitor-1/YccA family protein [Exiguobacterium]|uniref:Bax inhibitor-1/YccA family protein n=1 Tax=Exiguobacterium TaxID=33986 RepID=UPI000497ACF9|nr:MULTISPECIES: Bax inhibitor-1/YccA family protein [Exiguobacterium]KAB2865658.1 MAG: Bax inhibitor-1/YccA family protein [Exiguobacterium chiriqhucha]TCI74084.1 Bax inhibitor-1/YccA family protein [Exiguobacterium sp. IPCI3]TCI83239.1 Bax inhibitor-1/YccA family protein [Exiguobacterium sp. IPCH1]TCI84293.1 Bax inhibitor-1/YccA family protein [Exiguobacterium sp. IPBC4]